MKYGFDNLLINDREIFDTIYSQQQKLPNSKLYELCRNRGILLSPYEDRETLATYIANLYYDWNSIKNLLEQINHDDKSNKITSSVLHIDDLTKIKEVLKEISPEFERNQISVKNDGKSKVEVNMTTSKVELNKTRMIQRPLKDQTIILEKQDDKVIIRHNSDDAIKPFVERLIKETSIKVGKSIIPENIDLQEIIVPEFRNNFFQKLMLLDPALYDLNDVKRIRVHHNTHGSQEIILEDQESSIKSALLSGKSLHTNGMYKELKKLGHYITEITWVTKNLKDNIAIEINAGFENPKLCTGFFYDVKWFYKFSKRTNGFVKDPTKFKSTEKAKLNAYFDKTSNKIFKDITEEYNASLNQDGGTT